MKFASLTLLALAALPLASASGQTPAPPAEAAVDFTKRKSFAIPVEAKDPRRRSEVRSFQLWASQDKGAVWALMDSQKADAESLVFKDRGDGLYWLSMVIVYNDGRQDPPDPALKPPTMTFIVDTVPPVVKITSATRVGEEIAVEWTVDDKNPNDAVTAVYVRAAGATDTPWQQAPAETIQKRAARFKTMLPGAVVVSVVAADQARNSGSASKEIPAETTASYTPPPRRDPAAPGPAPLPPTPGPGPLAPPSGVGGGETLPVQPPSLTPTPGGGLASPPAIAPLPVEPPPAPALTSVPGSPLPTPGALPPPSSPLPFPPSAPEPQPLRTLGPGGLDALPPPGPARPAAAPVAELSNVQVIRSTRFDLGYNVDGGVSGVAQVRLYVTRDDGRTWVLWSVHDGRESPLKVALDNPRLHRDLRDAEGDYGFRLVPVSGAGLSDAPPAPGTAPEMRVHVDVTPPTVDVYPPQADPANRNALVLVWKATDKNFGKEPILIEYGETPNGPWKSVAAGDGSGRLPNTGSYSWAIPAGLAVPQVYLRVTATDLGGSKTERVTARPISLDLTPPKARINGIVATPPGR